MADVVFKKLRKVVEQYWGFREFRPLQEEAMRAELEGRDSVVVMPTGGGKSLCFQAPAVVRGGTTVVVSPLIALMKDQVDGLKACGIPALQLDSTLSAAERAACEFDLMNGDLRLLFVSPERLANPDFVRLLQRADIKSIAIDEAHCISHWGHDFRPEYRMMSRLKESFPHASVHAYTATATEVVRRDISKQLNLTNPLTLVGNFDRPNLSYRVLARQNLQAQILEVIKRHPGEAGIIYCLRRADVEETNAFLQSKGLKSLPYHAGLDKDQRRKNQDDFTEERCDLIAATVAFGMGIDRSNIRFVLHTGMPKSIEHYQQETGRAGRDGLEAECVLLYSGGDVMTWKRILEKSAREAEVAPDFLANANKHLDEIDRYARGAVCRHRALVGYFGQKYEAANCGACDLCLGDNELVTDAVVVAQKILSCVYRVGERFGINHVIGVLRGENTDKNRSYQHDQLSTFGLLKEQSKSDLREWIYQLIGQEVLTQTTDEYPVLKLNPASFELMKKQRSVRLLQPAKRKGKEKPEKSKADRTSWEGVDRELFESLRTMRVELARSKHVPPYIIFSDATLRELAKVRPSSLDNMRLVYGIGDQKLREYGGDTLKIIRQHCQDQDVAMDQAQVSPAVPAHLPTTVKLPDAMKRLASQLFSEGCSIEEVMKQTQRAKATLMEYLAQHIEEAKPANIDAWVPRPLYDKIAEAAQAVGIARLKPIFVELEEKVPYDPIRLVVAHLRAVQDEP